MKILATLSTMCLLGLVFMLFIGCGLKTGIVERLAITAVAQEMGIEFAKYNEKLTEEAIVYLDAIENFEADQYVNMLQIGINYAFDQLDNERAARLKPFVDQIMLEIEMDSDFLNFGKIEFPENFDYDALQVAVNGFRAGLTFE